MVDCERLWVKVECFTWVLSNKKFKLSSKINLDEVTMTYVGLYVTYERSKTSVLPGFSIPSVSLTFEDNNLTSITSSSF